MINIDDRVLDELNESETYLCLQIARYMKASRMTAWPSIETLAERCKWDERTVKRWRKSLEEKGFLDVTRTPGKPPTYQFKKSGFGVFHPLESVEPKAENGGSFFVPPAQNEGVQNLSLGGVQNLSLGGVQNLCPEVVSKRELVSNGEVVSSSTADAAAHAEPPQKPKTKKIAAPAAAKAPGWTKEWATAFDEVDKEKCTASGIPYERFIWTVCAEQSFAHLRNLREKAIIPSLREKLKSEGPFSEAELLKSARAVFSLAWDYFQRIATETGGSRHYTPQSIYKNFNTLKTAKQQEYATTTRSASQSSTRIGIHQQHHNALADYAVAAQLRILGGSEGGPSQAPFAAGYTHEVEGIVVSTEFR